MASLSDSGSELAKAMSVLEAVQQSDFAPRHPLLLVGLFSPPTSKLLAGNHALCWYTMMMEVKG